MKRRLHVVINPASGKPQPILHTLNRVFREAGVDWDISLTQESGDAERFARSAVASGADVVAAYGGDGTVMEVAQALKGTQTPLAILPGGSANLMSVELGIPKDLTLAAQIACREDSPVRLVDMGRLGQKDFLLRVGLGFSAKKVEYATRKLKNRFGVLAYSIAGIRSLKDTEKAQFYLTLDGQQHEVEGLTCLVDNAGNIGIRGVAPLPTISISDGLLDVIVVRSTAFKNMVTYSPSSGAPDVREESYHYWQAREIHIEATPALPVQVDGELAGETPVEISVVPAALHVLTQ